MHNINDWERAQCNLCKHNDGYLKAESKIEHIDRYLSSDGENIGLYEKNYKLAFNKMSKSRAYKIKDLKHESVLSVTEWGELTRVATVSWDKPEVRPIKSIEDGEALQLLLSWHDNVRTTGL